MVVKLLMALSIGLVTWSCAGSRPLPPAVAESLAQRLPGTDGSFQAIAPVPGLPQSHTVVVFFSADCHVLSAHDERIRRLVAEFAPRGIRFLAVDSEVDATLDRDRLEAARRGYAFPILLDRGARLAKALNAEFAGYSVVIDGGGVVLYRGGIDSDRVHLRDDATPYLDHALTDLLSGKPPRLAESKALGCALRVR